MITHKHLGGAAFKALGVPESSALTSNMNRAYQTAKLAGFDAVEKSANITEDNQIASPNENDRHLPSHRPKGGVMG